MVIEKYEKKGNGNYKIYFDNNTNVTINEDIILKHKLLYKKEIDEFYLEEIVKENNNYDIYNKCINYIGVRLRSTYEIREYMERKNVDSNLIEEVIEKLTKNKLLDDDAFTKAFVNDKFNFTTMGPFRIKNELEHHQIDSGIINKYISKISPSKISEKINKQIQKLMKSNKNKPNLKNKIYNNLLNLGYTSSDILDNLNNYDL
jgi:regulatory protein